MLIDRARHTVGSLSGGCLESEVAEAGLEVLQSGAARLISFDTRRRFGCNGAIEILLERPRAQFLHELSANLRARQKCRAATVFEGAPSDLGSSLLSLGEVAPAGSFVQEIHPQPQLIIFGDGPDSVPLRSFCGVLGWKVIEAESVSELPEEADEWTAAIIKSHNYGRDFSALQKLLPLPLRYLGLIGPRRRRDQLLGEVLDAGTISNAELHAPAGLDLAAETPEEIALSIISEVQSAFTGATGLSLREMKMPIHSLPRFEPPAFVAR